MLFKIAGKALIRGKKYKGQNYCCKYDVRYQNEKVKAADGTLAAKLSVAGKQVMRYIGHQK